MVEMEDVLNPAEIAAIREDDGCMSPSRSDNSSDQRISVVVRPIRPIDHAVNEFAQGVQLMADSETKADIGGLVKELVLAIRETEEKHGSLKIHPLLYANMVFIAGLIFSSGVLYQRINELERRQYQMQGVEGTGAKVEAMQSEIGRLRDRLDRFLDEAPARKK